MKLLINLYEPEYFDRTSFNLFDHFDFHYFRSTFAILNDKIWLLDDFTEAKLDFTAWWIHFNKRLAYTTSDTKRKLKNC